MTEGGPESLDYGSVGATDIAYEAPTALRDLDVVIDRAGPSGLLAAPVLHSCGVRTTIVRHQEYRKRIENFRTYLYALSPRALAIMRKQLCAEGQSVYVDIKRQCCTRSVVMVYFIIKRADSNRKSFLVVSNV